MINQELMIKHRFIISNILGCYIFHKIKTLHVDEAVLMLVELLEVSGDEAKVETI